MQMGLMANCETRISLLNNSSQRRKEKKKRYVLKCTYCIQKQVVINSSFWGRKQRWKKKWWNGSLADVAVAEAEAVVSPYLWPLSDDSEGLQ